MSKTAFGWRAACLLAGWIMGANCGLAFAQEEPDYIVMPGAFCVEQKASRAGPAARAPSAKGRLLSVWDEPEAEAETLPELSTLDVMVLYTTEAVEAYGEREVTSRIALSIAYLNEAFNRSGVHARARLVYQGETDWHREGEKAIEELYWLASDPTVAALRNLVGADLVSLYARHAKPNGGMAQLPGAFSVFNGSPFVFAHECGHNLGCAHDRANAETFCDRDECNFGYSFTPPGTHSVYGDLMSYVGSQIEQFSNPNRFFMGAPTGLPEGHLAADGTPNSADNALTLNRKIPYISLSTVTQAPRLEEASFSQDGTQFTFRISGPDDLACTVEQSGDQRNWTVLTRCGLARDGVEIVDPAPSEPCRFYRARFEEPWLPVRAGYVRKTVREGYAMLANPLENRENRIATLFPSAPEGVQVFKWIEGRQQWLCNTFSLNAWDDPAMSLHPGEGILVHNRSGAPWTISFTGAPNQALHNRIPLQFSIRGSAIPEGGLLSTGLGCKPFGVGGQVFRMTGQDGRYEVYTWDGESWSPEEPVLELGEAFWCRNPLNAFVWERLRSDE